MKEEKTVILTTGTPVTVTSLKDDFRRLGIKQGMVLLVHSSLRSLGWVCGGAVAVILALEEVLGEGGTLVMPAHTGSLSEPSLWQNPPVPESWWPIIRANTPAYDPELTPTRHMGTVAEAFRKQPGVLRSSHPQVSFAARGKFATRVTGRHSLDFCLGENSPLARIYELDGYVLLIGVGHQNNTSLHLAEYRSNSKGCEKNGAPILVNGVRVWRELEDIKSDDSDFEQIGEAFEKEHPSETSVSKVGQAAARLLRQRALVDYAVNWMNLNRK